MSRRGKVGIGAGMWAAAALGLLLLARAHAAELGPPLGKLGRFVWSRPAAHTVELKGPLLVGDPVLDAERNYLGRVTGLWLGEVPVGEVADGDPCRALLAIDPERVHVLPPDPRFFTRTAPRDGKWVIETLLPPHKRALLAEELSAFADEHHEQIAAFIRPIAEDVIEHGMGVLEANLRGALKKHEDELQALLEEHRGLVKEDLLPVLKKELGPSAKKKAEPLLREIGRELWNELPMWTLGWNAFVDYLPGTSRTRVDAWWAQFLEEKAIPIVASHEADLLEALEELVEEGARSPAVRKALGDATRRLAHDPDFKALVRGILEDALVRPFELQELLERLLKDPTHQERMQALSDAFAPTLQRIGRKLTIDEATGRIDPDLARVLRRVVFRKDGRWVELRPASAAAPAAGAGR